MNDMLGVVCLVRIHSVQYNLNHYGFYCCFAHRRVPKYQRKEKQLLDDVIDSINEAQTGDRGMKFIDPDKTQDQKQ